MLPDSYVYISNMAASVPDVPYVNPAFEPTNEDNHAPRNTSWTDPLPFAARFDPLHSHLPNEPLLPGPPNTNPIPQSMASPLVSPRLNKRSNRSSASSTLSAPISPVSDRRPSRFTSDFSHLKRASFQKSPDPAFKSHRKNFSEDINMHKMSAFREEVEDNEGNVSSDARNQESRETTPGQFQSVPLSAPTGLGLSYVPMDEGSGNKPGTSYRNLPDDDDDTSDDGASLKKQKIKYQPNWLSITIIILCIFSTAGSILFFVVAVARPRYGTRISTATGLRPQDAQLISAILAKTIELSFVSVFVSFLGQVLSRRALMTGSKGINIAELSMRGWVTQPGTLITHTASVRFAGLTFLGALSLTATILASFYTTAADTLVSPKLAWGSFEDRNLSGIVYSSYANNIARSNKCETIISPQEDPAVDDYLVSLSSATCDNILSGGRAYRDLSDWNALWTEARNQTFPDPLKRPHAPSALELTNYAGTWIQVTGENGVNRAIMAMPHPNVVVATKNTSLNGILQPEDSGSGYGSFIVKASTANPIVDVSCVPIGNGTLGWYLAQSNSSDLTRNGTSDPLTQRIFDFSNNSTFQNNGSFTYTGPYEAPRFPVRPPRYNTVLSSLGNGASVFMLTHTPADQYVICGMRSFMTPNCSTEFQAFENSGNATANCDLNNPLEFNEDLFRRNISTVKHPIPGVDRDLDVRDSLAADFRTIADTVLRSIALNNGVNGGNASIARFLSQLALETRQTQLNPARPSLAEALAVALGNAMITSSVETAYTTYWPYAPTVPLPVTEHFNAQVATIEYTSGAGSGWKPLFYVVLAGVLVMNVFCLIYFACVRDGFVTDWTEVQNLFCVAMDGGALRGGASMPRQDASVDERWKGTGGTGPAGGQYKVGFWFTEKHGRWYVTDGEMDGKSSTTGYSAV
ncbi:hypothetical protein Dda_9290 [Drechslerella dactyloides]|uniref:Uncharacterized protein n=1 Tax=Drechslerella dactyloides TaxID=74499 RepID=A0AAD6IPQ4_DREDA|nr:hypothetical protein Dda_9290 [Drechslerella dactyloides]